jgi:hypothetical protein
MRRLSGCRLVPGGNDPGSLDHEDHGAFGSAGTMLHALGHDAAMSWGKVDGPVPQVDQEATAYHVEELIFGLVLCQWYSPWTTPRRTTESFTLHSVWLYQGTVHAATSAGTSMSRVGPYWMLRRVS